MFASPTIAVAVTIPGPPAAYYEFVAATGSTRDRPPKSHQENLRWIMPWTGAGSSVEFEAGEAARCAACKLLRRRCAHDCALAPYFPASRPDRYACVHRVFGASNVTRLLQSLPVQERARAADAVAMEARSRVRDPVYGCAGIISRLQDDILAVQGELARTRAQLAIAVHAGGGTAHGQVQQAVSRPPPRAGAHHHVGMQMEGHGVQGTKLLDADRFPDLGDS